MRKQIATLDLEPIIVKALDEEEGPGWKLSQALAIAEEYRRFLQLCVENPDEPIVPAAAVDDFWHLHILDTQKYAEDCQQALGYFLHHFPYFGMRGAEDAENLQLAWQRTLELYEHRFGAADSEIWSGSHRCPNCGRRCRKSDPETFFVERPRLNTAHANRGAAATA